MQANNTSVCPVKKLILSVTLLACVLSTASYAAGECKVDQIKLHTVKTLKPALALDVYSTKLINELVTTTLLAPVSLSKTVGYAAKVSKTVNKIHNYQFKGVALSKRAADAYDGLELFEQIPDPIGDLMDSFIGSIDQSINTQDDLVVRINGVRVIPKNPATNFQPMLINETYPTSFGITHDITASFLSAADVSLIEYDTGSMNDNMGEITFFDVPDNECIYNTPMTPNEHCRSDTVRVISDDSGDDKNGAVYEVKYEIFPGKGNLDEIPERIMCNSSECFDAKYPLDYTYTFLNPDNKVCPSGYDIGYGLYTVQDAILGLDADSYNVCELIPHYVTPASPKPCGATYYDAEGYYYAIDSAEYQHEPGTIIYIKNKYLTIAAFDGHENLQYLSAQDGQYLARCNDCTNPTVPFVHAIDPHRLLASWQLSKLTNGKFTLRADNGQYLTYTGGYPVLKNTTRDDTTAQFIIDKVAPPVAEPYADNFYTISIDTAGGRQYLQACLDCIPGQKTGFRYAGHFTAASTGGAVTWQIGFRQKTVVDVVAASANGDGVYTEPSYEIQPTEQWRVSYGQVMIIHPGTTLNIDSGDKLSNSGTIINGGTINILDEGILESSGQIINLGTINIATLGALNNQGEIDNSGATALVNNGSISISINGGSNPGEIYDPNSKYSGAGSNQNTVINGYYLGIGTIGARSCAYFGGTFDSAATPDSCTLNNAWVTSGTTLVIGRNVNVILNGTLKNQGTLINDGSITDAGGSLNQCGVFDANGNIGYGTIDATVQDCVETVDEAICSQYLGLFDHDTKTCRAPAGRIMAGDVYPNTYLVIRTGVTWYMNGLIYNSGTISIEPGAELIINGGTIQNDSKINNLGVLSLTQAGALGKIQNENLINNPGIISNGGDLVGSGSVHNSCGGAVNVTPDWPARLSAGIYDMSGQTHSVVSDACVAFDTDADGVADASDVFPYDATETEDSDGDGVGNNADAFDNDPTETLDSDADGVGDNSDAFPGDASEWADSDGDTVGDNADAFPNDPTETVDSDGDGVGDNADAFPADPAEWANSDGEGAGDNTDPFPNDAQNLRLVSVSAGNGWALKNAQFVEPGGEYPWAVAHYDIKASQGMLWFELAGGTAGTAAVLTLTFDQPVSPYAEWWQFDNGSDYRWHNTGPVVVINGKVVTLTFTDGGAGDEDGAANGVIGNTNKLNIGFMGGYDVDNDGMSDNYEKAFGLNRFVNDAANDDDADGLTNIEEFILGTSPKSDDTDGDGEKDNVDATPVGVPVVTDPGTDTGTDSGSSSGSGSFSVYFLMWLLAAQLSLRRFQSGRCGRVTHTASGVNAMNGQG